MKPGSPPPPPPDDEAADPLLTALRERLGDYGQAPPPGAWAAIRRQVAPVALPQPWWRRRHLLAVLGLLLGCLLPVKLGEWAGLRQAGGPVSTANEPLANRAASRFFLVDSAGSPAAHRSAPLSADGAISSLEVASHNSATAASSASATRPQAAKTTTISIPSHTTAGLTASQLQALVIANEAARTGSARALAATTIGTHHIDEQQINTTETAITSHSGRLRLSSGVAAGEGRRVRVRQPSRGPLAALAKASVLAGQPTNTTYAATQRTSSLANRQGRVAVAAVSHQATSLGTISGPATSSFTERSLVGRQRARYARPVPGSSAGQPSEADSSAGIATAASTAAASRRSLLYPAGPLDLLAPTLSGLLLPSPTPLATLVAQPDSAPAAPPVRRWALLVLAGPTVSYRTLGPVPTLAAGHPDFARLERPALGLGAQVQVRRVLSGRWALAVGLGYHEYATRLALTLKDSAYTSIQQRDTYRLLTVPVQLSYALGVPKSRLSKALLLGAEPGWYLGGRSTEGSGCGCEQQAYTSAASSPYRPLTVAFSLGLDLRYRLGGAASRWQWLVQPTGRYVATPFVRRDAVGFTQRQPFSLGLLTGFSWDVR